nr:hypothetical protein Iba_chr10fCG6670 [Ipomoea batatas]
MWTIGKGLDMGLGCGFGMGGKEREDGGGNVVEDLSPAINIEISTVSGTPVTLFNSFSYSALYAETVVVWHVLDKRPKKSSKCEGSNRSLTCSKNSGQDRNKLLLFIQRSHSEASPVTMNETDVVSLELSGCKRLVWVVFERLAVGLDEGLGVVGLDEGLGVVRLLLKLLAKFSNGVLHSGWGHGVGIWHISSHANQGGMAMKTPIDTLTKWQSTILVPEAKQVLGDYSFEKGLSSSKLPSAAA